MIGRILVVQRKYQESLVWFDKILKLSSDNKEKSFVWYSKGIIFGELNQFENALASSKKSIFYDPNNAEGLYNTAFYLVKLKRNAEALKHVNDLIEIQNISNNWILKGSIHLNLKEYQQALKCFDKALELDPMNSEALNWKYNCSLLLRKNI